MGILPLQFSDGQDVESLGLTGHESYDITGLARLAPGGVLTVKATGDDGARSEFAVRVRIDTPDELAYYRNDGILQYVLRQLLSS